jgi:hypothetical protein
MSAAMSLPPELTPAPIDDETLAAEIDGDTDRKPWCIEDDGAAEWAGRKLVAAQGRLADVSAKAAEWYAQIEAWEAGERKGPEREAAYFANQIEDYARRRREADPKAKSLRLPSVTVTSRGSDTYRPAVVDDETVCNWLRGQGLGAYVSVKYSPKRRELTDAIEVKRVPGETAPCPECHGAIPDVDGCQTCDGSGSISDPDYFVPLLDGEEIPGVEVHPPTVSFTIKTHGGA